MASYSLLVELLVGEPDVAELDGAGAVAGDGLRRGRRCRVAVSRSLKMRSAGGHGGLQDVVFVAEVLDGPEEALRVLDEGDEDAEGDGAEDAVDAPPDEGDGMMRVSQKAFVA